MSTLSQKFVQILRKNEWLNRKMLIGVSGGMDSMVLAELLLEARQKFVIAHCNFGIRGEESDGDEKMVREWAKAHAISIFVKSFDVPKQLQDEGGNLENLARDLRYQWFEALRVQQNCDFVVVAHHQQDAVETLLMNFFRGTGIAGMHGILPQRDKIIRPLLTFSKKELRAYAEAHKIHWREDRTNQDVHYLRNKIRLELVPELRSIFPHFEKALMENMARMRAVEKIYDQAIKQHLPKLLEQRGKEWFLPVRKLIKMEGYEALMFEIFKDFGFSVGQIEDIKALIFSTSGKAIEARKYTVIHDRNFLIITPNSSKERGIFQIDFEKRRQEFFLEANIRFLMEKMDEEAPLSLILNKPINTQEEFVQLSREDFPLMLRKIGPGDYFYPLGLGLKKKKIGKFLRDLKVPIHQKEQVWILESKKRIVWVVGYRLDERFKIGKKSKNIFRLKIIFG